MILSLEGRRTYLPFLLMAVRAEEGQSHAQTGAELFYLSYNVNKKIPERPHSDEESYMSFTYLTKAVGFVTLHASSCIIYLYLKLILIHDSIQ
jgi:hypothetical protein